MSTLDEPPPADDARDTELAAWSIVMIGPALAPGMLAYAIGFPFAGYMMDKLGTRLGFTISLIVWSLAAALSGKVASASSENSAADFLMDEYIEGLPELFAAD